MPWNRYRAALLRYRWVVIAVALLGIGIGLLLTRTISPRYEAQATIWIASETPNGNAGGPIRPAELLNSQAWAELVRSYAVLDPVVERLQLYLWHQDPADSVIFRDFRPTAGFTPGQYELAVDPVRRRWTLTNAEDQVVDRGVVGDSIGRPLGFGWLPDSEALLRRQLVEFTTLSPRDAAVGLRSRLQATLPERSNFLTLRLTGTNPRRTASTLNAITEQFVETAAELKRRNLIEFRRVLQMQLQLAQDQLRDAEQRYRQFRSTTITLPSEGMTPAGGVELSEPIADSYFGQRAEYENLRRDRELLERLAAEVRQGTVGSGAIVAIPPSVQGAEGLRTALSDLAQAEAELRSARQFYTDEHPSVQQLQERVNTLRTREIPLRIEDVAQQLRQREADLQNRVQGAARELQAIPARTVEAMRVRRELDLAQNLYTTLQSRFEGAKLAEASAIPDVSILDAAAAPQFPTSNTAPRILLIAILAALALGVAVAIFLDRIDSRLRYPEQATKELGLEILGAIPAIHDNGASAPGTEAAAQVVEAFRAIRLSLINAQETEGPLLVTISSPGPGDGKSLVSANLALSFAEAGYRTVLVDGDIRRGEQHRVFDVERRPGLYDYLNSEATVADVLRETSAREGLDLIPCGTRRHRGPELLASSAMPALIAQLQREYDVVIVDSPPLVAGIDPYALASVTGNVLMVLRPGLTDRKMAAAKLEMLERFPVRILGAVLNDIHGESHYRYYSYQYGYATVDEDADPRALPVGELSGRA